ncbi:YebC/PmpR family DNA-binding transcriptional regulator [Spiroplasma endosymbiont of Lariophagus distinguendus]|uniref:YebC/PmpR family DNA-binding transcriptional regulator n=1 Tax=Spiroplasma endosymbiont of Lariophagus distinguendus TaxID=2935082 RepID=UPI00207AB5B2|nr:YebC/PmpR family DNA-binding transcriptional regulator [Spiroplasma endosymbiont of Lariophagus distinguendus]
MAGHSQYANIKHRKDAQDNKRGKIFQKLSREIYVAVKLGGANVENNPRLKLMLEKARRINMPKDNINRAINKASNKNETTNYEAVTYEGYGPSNIAIIIHCLTDNKNRTASNIRSYFNKLGGHLAATNSVQYLFQTMGVIQFSSLLSVEEILELIIDFEIFNIKKKEDIIDIEVNPKQLNAVTNLLEKNNINDFITNEIVNIPHELITITDQQQIKLIDILLETIENDDDVLSIEHNFKK